MAILSLQEVTFGFGAPPLLDQVGLVVEEGERLVIVGRNGAGKSTLLKLLAGEYQPDQGEFAVTPGVTLGALWQEVPVSLDGTVLDEVSRGLGEAGEQLSRYAALSESLDADSSPQQLAKLEELQKAIDTSGGWDKQREVDQVITYLSLDASADVSSLSAGKKRRTLLAKALVRKPQLLLLDEPTNHLDIDSVLWLEDFLARYKGTIIFITHDRRFLKRVATRIVELDRGQLTSFSGNYDKYLEEKQELLEVEARKLELLNKKLAQEEAWIRGGIRARRTRNEGRVRALHKLRSERRDVRDVQGTMSAKVQEAERSGKLVLEAHALTFSYDENSAPIVRSLTTKIFRGDRIGILGPNGVGKTTLLRVLLGELQPTEGTVRHGTRLQVAYFDQIQEQLDLNKSIAENVGDGHDTVGVEGSKRHIYSYLQDFLFTPEQCRAKVGALSGGERNRVLLAKLFTQPANVLVLDEPTNDLDVPALELLEEMVTDFSGTVMVVSHDREFVDNVVTSALVFDDDGNVREFVGTYEEFMRQRSAAQGAKKGTHKSQRGSSKKGEKKKDSSANDASKRLSYDEKKELKSLPAQIEALEARKEDAHEAMLDPKFYQRPRDEVAAHATALEQLEKELEQVYARWEELESRSG